MISERLWEGWFHHHIMTTGGRRATQARTGQLDSKFRFPAMPAIQTADTHRTAVTTLIDRSCIQTHYWSLPVIGVSLCTRPLQPSGRALRQCLIQSGPSRVQKCTDRSLPRCEDRCSLATHCADVPHPTTAQLDQEAQGFVRRASKVVGDLLAAVSLVIFVPFVILAIGTPIALGLRFLLWIAGLL